MKFSFDIIRVCTSYKYNNKAYNYLPLGLDDLNQLSTEYIELNGWKEKTKNKRKFSELPLNAKKYISFIEEFIGIPVTLLSTSPEREDTILFQDPFES